MLQEKGTSFRDMDFLRPQTTSRSETLGVSGPRGGAAGPFAVHATGMRGVRGGRAETGDW